MTSEKRKLEKEILQKTCESNDSILIVFNEKNEKFIYRSRFIEISFDRNIILIDEPSAETVNAKPLAVGESVEVFFEFKDFRYLFESNITGHSMHDLGQKKIHVLEIRLPSELKDGERREYFRIEPAPAKALKVFFNIYDRDSGASMKDSIVKGKPELFDAKIIDISGGGFAMKCNCHKFTDVKKGDYINAKFELLKGTEISVWCEIRNKRKFHDSEDYIIGVQFMEERSRNPQLRALRNKIMRYVTVRQREILSL